MDEFNIFNFLRITLAAKIYLGNELFNQFRWL